MNIFGYVLIFLVMTIGLLCWGNMYSRKNAKTNNMLGWVYLILAIGSLLVFASLGNEKTSSLSNVQYSVLMISAVSYFAFGFMSGRELPKVGDWIYNKTTLLENKSKEFMDKQAGSLGFGLVLLVGYISIASLAGWTDKYVNGDSPIYVENHYVVLVESRAPWGSWFNRDVIRFGDKEMVFVKKSVFYEHTSSFPYSKIPEITITDGQLWNKLDFSVEGKWFNKSQRIYFMSDKALNPLLSILDVLKAEGIVVKKGNSLVRGAFSLFGGAKKQS